MTICNIKNALPYWENNELRPIIDSSLTLWISSDFGDNNTWIDKSGYNNNANNVAGGARSQLLSNDIFGSGFYFNGSSYMSVLDNISLQQAGDWTLEADVKFTSVNVGTIIIRTYTSSNRNYIMYTNNGHLGAGYHKITSGYWVETTNLFNDGNFHKYQVTYDDINGNLELNVDGIPQSITTSGTPGQAKVSPGNMLIGNSTTSSTTGERYIGYLYDIKFYKKKLTSSEKTYNYTHSPLYYIQKGIQ